MLTHRGVTLISFLLVAGLFLSRQLGYWYAPGWIFIIILLVYLGFVVRGAMRIEAGFFLPVICEGPTPQKVMSITFDDGPLPEYTPVVLEILKAAKVPATFFVIGKNAAGNAALLQRIHEDGHLIGNHSFSHDFWFDIFGTKRMQADMQKANDVVKAATGVQPRLFRPPYGVTNPNLARAIKRGNFVPVGWNIRSLDTVAKEEAALLQRILDRLKPGAILLLHDTCKITVNILPELIREIKIRGYKIERLDKLINTAPYA